MGSPNRVFDILGVESDEEAEDGEEHDTVGCQHQATCSTINLKNSRVRRLNIYRMKVLQLTIKRNRKG